MNQTLAEEPGNEQRSEREGQPLGPSEIKAPLTQAGVSAEISNGNPIGGCRRKIVSGPTEIEKPVAVADVAGASGPAVTGAGGPVVAGNVVLGSY